MPFNSDFLLPLSEALTRKIALAPRGSMTMPVMEPASLIAWKVGVDFNIPVELTTFSAPKVDPSSPSEDVGLVFTKPQFFVEPCTAYTVTDEDAHAPGDLITNGDTLMIIAMAPAQELGRFILNQGTSNAPLVLYKGWRIFIDGQHIFTKLP